MRMLLAWTVGVALCLGSAGAQAQQDWWFDIEVILFDRGQSVEGLKEDFERAPELGDVNANWDLLSALFQPDISLLKQTLPDCDAPPFSLWVPEPSLMTITGYRPTFNLADFEPEKKEEFTQTNPSTANRTFSDTPSNLATSDDSATVTPSQIARLWLAFHGPEKVTTAITDTQFCEQPQPWISWRNNEWHVYQPDNRLPYPAEIPIEPEGYDKFDGTPHVLSAQSNELTKLSQQIRQTRGLTRLLHLTWRQPVMFGQDEAPSVRLFAGKDYNNQFMHSGQARPEASQGSLVEQSDKEENTALAQTDFLSALQARLNRPERVSLKQMLAARNDSEKTNATEPLSALQNNQQQGPIWQVDGYLKVYLKNVNQVPYLHIDSRLFYRQPVPLSSSASDTTQPEYELVAVPFHQMRRVISKQLHYFDHPLFGMVVKIRRFNVPEGM